MDLSGWNMLGWESSGQEERNILLNISELSLPRVQHQARDLVAVQGQAEGAEGVLLKAGQVLLLQGLREKQQQSRNTFTMRESFVGLNICHVDLLK